MRITDEANHALYPWQPFTDFELTPTGNSTDHPDKYILIGKGHS
jgi:hypothetical protein